MHSWARVSIMMTSYYVGTKVMSTHELLLFSSPIECVLPCPHSTQLCSFWDCLFSTRNPMLV